MASKVELYREVLEIEPNSKVFFPLARQLSEEGRADEAAAVLARGIAFHPDHLEAKFLLIEILARQGREGEADAVFADVGSLLARYPSVWLLWSKAAATRSKDPALAILFLAHYFQNESLTWAEVMERGLASLSRAVDASAGPQAVETGPGQPEEPPAPAPEESAAPAAAPVEPSVPLAAREPGAAPPLRGAREVMELADILEGEAPDEVAERGKIRPAKGREPAVRTKTMAALLAEQGDAAGALDIYNELLAGAVPGPEREDLLGCIAALAPATGAASPVAPDHLRMTADAEEAGTIQATPERPGAQGAAKLVSLLETLAGRLEARAGA